MSLAYESIRSALDGQPLFEDKSVLEHVLTGVAALPGAGPGAGGNRRRLP